MTRWNVDRVWRCSRSGTDTEEFFEHTSELLGHDCVLLLGPAGSGKTVELDRMQAAARAGGAEVRFHRLATTDLERVGLDRLHPSATVILDALDEAMAVDRSAATNLAKWLGSLSATNLPRLRLSCRSAVLPPEVRDGLEALFPKGLVIANLQPLDEASVVQAAIDSGIEPQSFLAATGKSRVAPLTQHPLTLGMLLTEFRCSQSLPRSRNELFSKAIARLAEDRDERRRMGTHNSMRADELVRLAESVACLCLLSGREVIDLSDEPRESDLAARDITALGRYHSLITNEGLERLAACGLCEGDEPRRFRFVHRQIAEYLAGTAIGRLAPHQARSLLQSPQGWKFGVAGALRETAAFAALGNRAVLAWIAEHDPVIVGLSEVADERMRRESTLALLEKFRKHELTDAQVRSGRADFAGLRYQRAAQDLRPLLRARTPEDEDLLEAVVDITREWRLKSLSNDLADLVLDSSAPHHPRVAAGYALAEMGSRPAKRRLLALLEGSWADPDRQLRGVALRCNWPGGLTDEELLIAINVPRTRQFAGAFEGFLYDLDRDKFAADGARASGLEWARPRIRRGDDYDPEVRVAKRIAHSALGELEDPSILRKLASMLLSAGRSANGSPLSAIRKGVRSLQETHTEAHPLEGRTRTRRMLLAEMARIARDKDNIWWAARSTPHLLETEDFLWALDRARSATRSPRERRQYAELARSTFRADRRDHVDAWLACRHLRVIRTALPWPVSSVLGSSEAMEAKNRWIEERDWARESGEPPLVVPSPRVRIDEALRASEERDHRFFGHVCRELTLEERSTQYGWSRFLASTPGWAAADATVRARIVEAAKRFLVEDSECILEAQSQPLNSILSPAMAAIWLVWAEAPDWLRARGRQWWRRWSWYLFRELHPTLHGEPDEPKLGVFSILRERSPSTVRGHILQLAVNPKGESRHLLESMLEVIEEAPLPSDAVLDRELRRAVSDRKIADDRAGLVAAFLLRNGAVASHRVCLKLLRSYPEEGAMGESGSHVDVAVALLQRGRLQDWDAVLDELETQPDWLRATLSEYAHRERLRRRQQPKHGSDAEELGTKRIGRLVGLLFRTHPPSADPRRDGAHWIGPSDSARVWRNQSLTYLGDRDDAEAVEALRCLERDWGDEYPWVRRPRARAERALALRWSPVPLEAIARVIGAGDARLVRNADDAVEGVIEAIRAFELGLRQGSARLEALWNTDEPPAPKHERHYSEVLRDVIERYFEEYAVTADREVEIRRRMIGAERGGRSGSEVDIVVRVPGRGTVIGDPIVVPIEVKRSCNPEACTGLRSQLVDRYMKEDRADAGVFVVMWLDSPGLAAHHRPKWRSIGLAAKDLEFQARSIESGADRRVAAIVVDCALT